MKIFMIIVVNRRLRMEIFIVLKVLFGDIILSKIIRVVFIIEFVVCLIGKRGNVGKIVNSYYIIKVMYFFMNLLFGIYVIVILNE